MLILRSVHETFLSSIGLLILRFGTGLMMLFGHGIYKLMAFDEMAATFPDPIGFGSTFSLALAIFAEVVCSALLVLGYRTRVVAVPLLITMLVAVCVIHADDPWSKKEFALLYALPFLTLIFTGGGALSLDGMRRQRK